MTFVTHTILSILLLVGGGTQGDPVNAEAGLQIYLPRDVTVPSAVPKLGQIAIIRGSDALADRVNDIAVGRIGLPGQAVVIDRHQILGRLASYGIEASEVTLTGALKSTITQAHRVVSGDTLAAKARDFLKAHQTDMSVCGYQLLRTPKEVVVPGREQQTTISVEPLLSSSRVRSGALVSVFADDTKIAQRRVIFQLKFRCYRLVAKTDINRGERVTKDSVTIQPGVADYPDTLNRDAWVRATLSDEGEPEIPAGLIARRPIPADTAIQTGMVGPVKPDILIKRRQNVEIRFEQFRLTVTAAGVAEQEGTAGDVIKVRNVDSKRIIMARINDDGTVSPIL